MESLTSRKKIEQTYDLVSNMSYQTKKEDIYSEESINVFLDTILEFKKGINDKTNRINHLVDSMEELTWFDTPVEDDLKLLNNLIAICKDFRISLIKSYLSFSGIRQRGVAKEEIKAYKRAADDLKEMYEDLESAFFILPKDPLFVKANKELKSI